MPTAAHLSQNSLAPDSKDKYSVTLPHGQGVSTSCNRYITIWLWWCSFHCCIHLECPTQKPLYPILIPLHGIPPKVNIHGCITQKNPTALRLQNHFASPSSFCCIVREVWAQKRFICIFYGGKPRTQNTYLAFVSNRYKNIHNLLLLQIFKCYQDDDHTYLHISYSLQNMLTKVSIHGCITQWNLTP